MSFAIEEAKKYFTYTAPGQGSSDLTPDGTHLREGIAPMITGMHLMQVLCERFGINDKVLSNKIMMTQELHNSLNYYGSDGTVDESKCTQEDYYNVQWCSIQGTKETKAFYSDVIKELKNEQIN